MRLKEWQDLLLKTLHNSKYCSQSNDFYAFYLNSVEEPRETGRKCFEYNVVVEDNLKDV